MHTLPNCPLKRYFGQVPFTALALKIEGTAIKHQEVTETLVGRCDVYMCCFSKKASCASIILYNLPGWDHIEIFRLPVC